MQIESQLLAIIDLTSIFDLFHLYKLQNIYLFIIKGNKKYTKNKLIL